MENTPTKVSPEGGNKEEDFSVSDLLFKGNRELGKKESEGKLFYELDWDFLTQMAERMQSNKNNGKYEKWNWKKPTDVEELSQAIFRHTLAIMKGEYEDDDREMGHLEALANNAMMLNYQIKNNE